MNAKVANTWPASRWKDLYGRAWIDKYGGNYYGMDSDPKAMGRLSDLLEDMPEIERIATQAKATAMFAEFLSNSSPALVDARHPFAFFVTAFGGLRVGRVDPSKAAPPDPYCDFHRQPRSRGKKANRPLATCPECKHVSALARPRSEGEPESAAAILAQNGATR